MDPSRDGEYDGVTTLSAAAARRHATLNNACHTDVQSIGGGYRVQAITTTRRVLERAAAAATRRVAMRRG